MGRVAVLCCALAFGAALAGCGGDGDASSGGIFGAAGSTTKTRTTTLSYVRPVDSGALRNLLAQWRTALHGWQGGNFLVDPAAKDLTQTSQRAELFSQWWSALQARRGSSFLVDPSTKNLGNGDQLRQLLAQWWQALEAWRGSHFLLQPNL